jgi:hypothetical protein
MVGFGIDLAGYTTGKTSLAFVEIKGRSVKATILVRSALSRKQKLSALLKDVLPHEVAVVRRCLEIGPVAVDIPIDLQRLPKPANPKQLWELTLRPIDKSVKALPPFADRIGSPVARFAAIMRVGKFRPLLGRKLFEAYPAGTLRTLKIAAGQYKGAKGLNALNSLCKKLRIKPRVKNDDEIDAIICAITAAARAKDIHKVGKFRICGPLPIGFRIPKKLRFNEIEVTRLDFEEWLKAREVSRGR